MGRECGANEARRGGEFSANQAHGGGGNFGANEAQRRGGGVALTSRAGGVWH